MRLGRKSIWCGGDVNFACNWSGLTGAETMELVAEVSRLHARVDDIQSSVDQEIGVRQTCMLQVAQLLEATRQILEQEVRTRGGLKDMRQLSSRIAEFHQAMGGKSAPEHGLADTRTFDGRASSECPMGNRFEVAASVELSVSVTRRMQKIEDRHGLLEGRLQEATSSISHRIASLGERNAKALEAMGERLRLDESLLQGAIDRVDGLERNFAAVAALSERNAEAVESMRAERGEGNDSLQHTMDCVFELKAKLDRSEKERDAVNRERRTLCSTLARVEQLERCAWGTRELASAADNTADTASSGNAGLPSSGDSIDASAMGDAYSPGHVAQSSARRPRLGASALVARRAAQAVRPFTGAALVVA